MSKSIEKIGVMTSGGDAPGMNAAIRSVVRTCAYYNIKCIGIYRGYEGLIAGDFVEMNARSVRDIINKGGTILRSARSKEFRTISLYLRRKNSDCSSSTVDGFCRRKLIT